MKFWSAVHFACFWVLCTFYLVAAYFYCFRRNGVTSIEWTESFTTLISDERPARVQCPRVRECLGRYPYKCNVILTTLLLYPAFLARYTLSGSVPFFVVFYVAYLYEVFCRSSALLYLKNKRDSEKVRQKWEEFRRNAPLFVWQLQNYHMYTEGGLAYDCCIGLFYWREETKRLNTDCVQGTLQFPVSIDHSPEFPDFRKFPLIKANVALVANFGNDDTCLEYHKQKRRFVYNNSTDDMQEFSKVVTLDGLVPKLLIVDAKRTPLCMSVGGYALSSLLFFSCCFRTYMEVSTAHVKYTFAKQVFVGDAPSVPQPVDNADGIELVALVSDAKE